MRPPRIDATRLVAGLALLALAAGSGFAAWAAGWRPLAVLAATAAGAALAGGLLLLQRRQARRGARHLAQALSLGEPGPGPESLARGLRNAVQRLRRSPLGQSGAASALYALPWYVLIGEPAAGKSSAVRAAGLGLGADDGAVRGVGGTRDCDWFFGSEAIVLDTAGRYAVQPEDRAEWLGFLRLLRQARPRAPVDGVVVVASAAELAALDAGAVIDLARRLRARVHELSEQLAVAMPVYLVFTKLDRVAGFEPFFADADSDERERVWGATLSCRDTGGTAGARFDQACAELQAGLHERALARLGAGSSAAADVLGFPLEFAALRPALSSFVATLFDDDPYHLRPLLRGFYFTSAEQPGTALPRATEAAARRFGLPLPAAGVDTAPRPARAFFLAQFFARVLGADRGLVRRHIPPRRLRLRRTGYALALAGLAGSFGALSSAYLDNRRVVAQTAAELGRIATRQDSQDLDSRLQALEQLQQRLQSLAQTPGSRLAWFGLGQQATLERRLLTEYHAGLRTLMLAPVAVSLEQELDRYLQTPATGAGGAQAQPAYDALRAYLMLGDPSRREPAVLAEAVSRHWRGWLDAHRGSLAEDELLRRTQAIVGFALARAGLAQVPSLQTRAALVDAARQRLRAAQDQGAPEDRVFDEIRSRAAARYAAVDLAALAGPEAAMAGLGGSVLVSGAFTREAWRDSVEPAIREAAEGALQRHDWVLDAGSRDDLSLRASPAQVRQALAERYRREHAAAWKHFAEGVELPPFRDLDDAVRRLERLADPAASPLGRLVAEIARQSVSDEPRPAPAPAGPGGWMRSTWEAVVTPATAQPAATESRPPGAAADGTAGLATFAGLERPGDSAAPMQRYLQALAQVRARLQTLVRQGDPGAGARELLAATLSDATGSELAAAMRLTEELLAATPAGARETLRPLLLQPLLASAAVLVAPAESELNRRWAREVHEPFVRGAGARYPFDPAARVEAGADEIARTFGPEGSLVRYVDAALGPLVVRRGEGFEPRRWHEIGIRLRPETARGLPAWLAGSAAPPGPAAAAATVFQMRPLPSSGLVEYTLEIDGQTLRYRNTAAGWTDFVWPRPGATPGVRIRGTTADGATVAFVEAPGSFGLDRAFELAQRTRQPDGETELGWTQDGHTLRVRLRVVRSGEASAAPGAWRGLRLPPKVAGDEAAAPPAAPLAAMASAR